MLAAVYKSCAWCGNYVQHNILYICLTGIQSELYWQPCTRLAHGASIMSNAVYILV